MWWLLSTQLIKGAPKSDSPILPFSPQWMRSLIRMSVMLKPTNKSRETDDAMITPPKVHFMFPFPSEDSIHSKDLTLRTSMPYFELKKSPIPAFYHPWVPFTEDEKVRLSS